MKSASHAGTIGTDLLVVLLAAGAGSRFKGPRHKLLANLPRPSEATPTSPLPTVFSESLLHALQSGVGPIRVITGAIELDDLMADPASSALLERADVVVSHNPDWAAGQSTSLHAALRMARQAGATRLLVGLADQPFISPDAWRSVALGVGPITVATYDGRRANPVQLHADVWGLLPTSGDEGARILMRECPELVTEVACTGSPADIDTVEDLRPWQNN